MEVLMYAKMNNSSALRDKTLACVKNALSSVSPRLCTCCSFCPEHCPPLSNTALLCTLLLAHPPHPLGLNLDITSCGKPSWASPWVWARAPSYGLLPFLFIVKTRLLVSTYWNLRLEAPSIRCVETLPLSLVHCYIPEPRTEPGTYMLN